MKGVAGGAVAGGAGVGGLSVREGVSWGLGTTSSFTMNFPAPVLENLSHTCPAISVSNERMRNMANPTAAAVDVIHTTRRRGISRCSNVKLRFRLTITAAFGVAIFKEGKKVIRSDPCNEYIEAYNKYSDIHIKCIISLFTWFYIQ